jgi:hypothetical protein
VSRRQGRGFKAIKPLQPTKTKWKRIMQVQVIHEGANGARTDFGIQELDHMPPVGEPFPVDSHIYYTAKAYFGPDDRGLYLLVLEGRPKLVE